MALLAENLGQPGFRELILRAADLETGRVLPFVLLDETHRKAFLPPSPGGPARGPRGPAGAVDLRAPGYDALFFDAGRLGPPVGLTGPVRRCRSRGAGSTAARPIG